MEPLRYRRACVWWPMFLKLSIFLYFLACVVHLSLTYYGMLSGYKKEDTLARKNVVFHPAIFKAKLVTPDTKHPLHQAQSKPPSSKTHSPKPNSKSKKSTSKKPLWNPKPTHTSRQTSTPTSKPTFKTSAKPMGPVTRKQESLAKNNMVFHPVIHPKNNNLPSTTHDHITTTNTAKPTPTSKRSQPSTPKLTSQSKPMSTIKSSSKTKMSITVRNPSQKWKGCSFNHTFCGCEKRFSCWRLKEYMKDKDKDGGRQSSCGPEATLEGPKQKVVSYVLFGSRDKTNAGHFPYHKGIQANVDAVKKIYPGWKMRVYSNVPPVDEECSLLCKEDNLFWCDVNNVPNIGNISDVWPPMWRFLPIGDPLVDVFISRDVDSVVGPRERKAVKEWEEKWPNKTFHLMRDHPGGGQRKKMLAGMWGAKVWKLGQGEGKALQSELMKLGRGGSWRQRKKGFDQVNLANVLWKGRYVDKILAHDHYFCKQFRQTTCIEFPDKERPEKGYVGRYLYG